MVKFLTAKWSEYAHIIPGVCFFCFVSQLNKYIQGSFPYSR